MKKKVKRKRKPSKISTMKKKAWKVFSRYIKLKASIDTEGLCKCVTCGDVRRFDDPYMHAGHFLDGRTKGILFEERCVHPQCFRCNVSLDGNKDAYWPYMLDHYGQDVINDLLAQKHTGGSWTRDELEEIRVYYERKLEDLLSASAR